MTRTSTARAFAEVLTRHRITAGLSQRELAGRSGLSERALRDLERGTTVSPRRRSVQAVASALGLHGDELTRFIATALARDEESRATIPLSPIDDLVGRGHELHRLADAICRAIDGLPLAVELAAARTRMMTAVELAARFDRQLRLLTDGAADLPARHRSLRATIESSLEVVTGEGRTLFAWLGAFAGGGLLADLEAVAARLGCDEDWLPAALGELVDTSLVRVQTSSGASRYLMPDAMTELAREHLAACADRESVERAVAVRFLYWVRHFERQPTRDGRRDADNVHTAARFAIASDISLLDPGTIRALHTYYEFTGRLDEGRRLLLAAATSGAPLAYLYAGRLTRFLGDLTEAARLGHLAMASNEPAETHMHLGAVATEAGESVKARSHFRAALASARRSKDIGLTARALNGLGALSAETGRLDHAERLFTAALEAKRRSGASVVDLRAPLHNLAEIALELGLYERALARVDQAPLPMPNHLIAQTATVRALALLGLGRHEAAREAARQVEHWLTQQTAEHRYAAMIRLRCSVILASTGDPVAAAQHLRIGLPEMLDSTQRYHAEAATALEAHAHLLVGRDAVIAARLLGAAGRLRLSQRRPASQATVATLDAALRDRRKALGDSRFNHERRIGSGLGVAALAELCGRIA